MNSEYLGLELAFKGTHHAVLFLLQQDVQVTVLLHRSGVLDALLDFGPLCLHSGLELVVEGTLALIIGVHNDGKHEIEHKERSDEHNGRAEQRREPEGIIIRHVVHHLRPVIQGYDLKDGQNCVEHVFKDRKAVLVVNIILDVFVHV